MAATLTEKTSVAVCAICKDRCEVRPLKSGSPALPSGWKWFGDKAYCSACRKAGFFMRSIVLPVWSVQPDEGESTKAANDRWFAALRTSFGQAAAVGTWVMRELARLDNAPIKKSKGKDGKEKATLPKLKDSPNLYKMARSLAPDLDSQSCGCVVQAARSKYNQTRWDQRVTLKVGLPKFGYPAPVLIPGKDAKLEYDKENNLWLFIRMSGERFRLRLARGRRFLRQHVAVKKGLAGLARFGTVTITGRSDNGKLCDIRARLSMESPRDRIDRENILNVKTTKDRLFVGTLNNQGVDWNLNEDHIQSVIVAHKRRLQRLSEDKKFERRIGGRKGIEKVTERLSEKYNARMADVVHKAAAMLVEYAVRCNVGTIRYYDEDVDQRRFKDFPWFKLRTLVIEKAFARGIAVETGESLKEMDWFKLGAALEEKEQESSASDIQFEQSGE